MLRLYKGTISVDIDDKENCVYTVNADVGFQFREVLKYVRPLIKGKTYVFHFIPTKSPRFGETHVLKSHYLKDSEEEVEDGQGKVLSNRRMLIHGGSKTEHSMGCWMPYRDGQYIKGFRYSPEDEVKFELVCI